MRIGQLREFLQPGRLLGRGVARWEDWWFHHVDARIYALVRIAFALVAIINFVDMLPLRYTLLASNGMMGLPAAHSFPGTFSIYFWWNSPLAVDASLVVFGAALIALLVGWHANLAAALTFLWHLSYSHIALTALGGYDSMFRNIGLILMISPIAAAWSLDARRRRHHEPAGPLHPRVPRYGLLMLQWQVLVIYVMSFWNKAPDAYWRNGEAVSYFLMSNFAFFPHPIFAHMPVLNSIATYTTLFVELSVTFLLWGKRTRPLGFALGWGLHFGIALTRVYLFSLVIMTAYFAFLDDEDFADLRRLALAAKNKAFRGIRGKQAL